MVSLSARIVLAVGVHALESLQEHWLKGFFPSDNAESFKNDGNNNFKLKKYRWAIDNYTEGIKCKSKDRELNAILYSNRAAAHFHLGKVTDYLRWVNLVMK